MLHSSIPARSEQAASFRAITEPRVLAGRSPSHPSVQPSVTVMDQGCLSSHLSICCICAPAGKADTGCLLGAAEPGA